MPLVIILTVWLTENNFEADVRAGAVDMECGICNRGVLAELVSSSALIGTGVPLLVAYGAKKYALRCSCCSAHYQISSDEAQELIV